MTQTMMHFTNGNNEIDSFKCSFDLGSKKHRILDKQYTQGKNYVDISLLDLGDLLRRTRGGNRNTPSAWRKEAQEKKRKNKEQSLNSTPVSTPVKKQKKVKENNNNNNDNSSNDSGATVATHNNEKPKTPKKPRSLTASQKKSQSSLSIDTKASVDRGALLNTTTTNNKSGLTSDSDNENFEANKREEEEPEEEKPLTDEELARRMHLEMNASPRLGRTGGRSRNRAMSLLGSF
ncbi:unnamed protein product [Bathycoccus prasinos]